jgi:predicted ATPase/DNA-binding SARP family transcriptional activator/Tfp pilus assembly protein PilF
MFQETPSTSLGLTLLGPPQLERDGEPVHISTRKAMALLAYLAVTEQVHSRESLATLFWPDLDQSRALANLRRTLWILSNRLGEDWLEINAETAALHPEAGIWLDLDAFRHLLSESQSHDHGEAELCAACAPTLIEAVQLYEDDFMAGFTLPDCPAFDEWQFFEREGLRAELADALQRLVRWYSAQKEWAPAITYARRWLALDPLHEPAHRSLMRLYAWDGQRAAALRQYGECVRILEEELAVPPEEKTTQLYEAIQTKQLALPQGVVAPSAAVPADPPQRSPRHNLPPQPTPFVGREEELAEIARLLQDPDCRLLTLVGPGGVGKSRLALEAAAGQLDHSPNRYRDGVCWVALAPVTSTDAVVPTLAAALDFTFYPREGETPKQQLLNYLCEKQMLLLLDNIEHLLGSADLLSEILECAPGVRLLVTSRERLNLQPEWVYQVTGLRCPPDQPVESVKEYDAPRLFLRRARQIDTGFAPGGEQIPNLTRICRLVDGMPLGLELAASWVNMMSCGEIASEIERNLDFLTTSLRDVPERHQTLRAVCDQSWALLTQKEQSAFAGLSVFRGGFSREAAERVAGASLPLLSALVDKSLARPSPSGRYDVHPLLHQYAAEQLSTDPQAQAAARERHSTYYLEFLQQRESALKGADQMQALSEIGADLDNVRAAWRWATAHGGVAEIRGAAPALWLFYERRSLFEEGERAFAQAVAMLEARADRGADGDLALGLALAFQGRLCIRRFCLEDGAMALREGLPLLRRLGAQEELGLVLSFAFRDGVADGFAEAEALFRESLTLNRALGQRWEVAFALFEFCSAAAVDWRGLVTGESFQQYLQESYQLSHELGDRWTTAAALVYMGEYKCSRGAYEEGMQHLEESLAVMREIGDGQSEQYILDNLGYYARRLGQYEEARQCHHQSLQIANEVGDGLGVAGSLYNLGLVAYNEGNYEEATGYAEQSLALRRQLGRTWETGYSVQLRGHIALARGEVDEALGHYQAFLDVAQGFEWMQVDAWRGLGEVYLAAGDVAQAAQRFFTALELATRVEALDEMLDTLRAVAQLAAGRGETEWAVEVLAHVLSHTDIDAGVRGKAETRLAGLASQLPPETVEAAQERGRGKSLDAILKEAREALRE